MLTQPTPVRALGARSADGSIMLRDVGLAYRDGGEEAVLNLVEQASDLSSTSDELIRGAQGWAQTYHLHPGRANVVRTLEFPAGARVLEIGAGCGAITRYLGETVALVDAVEPVPGRAAVARARTRDLDNVEVFVGELSDVPEEPAYDVVLVIGVLEYVAMGGDDRNAYLAFLRDIAARLVEGGTLVLAIENQLGVKYLAGAPEDHSARTFDSLENYPVGTPARTFSRRQLNSLLCDAGLNPVFRVAFPDYKITRAVMGNFPEAARSLLHRIPQFPSPDWTKARPQLADERAMWRTLVEAGLELESGNSFLVLAGKGTESGLWPVDVAATFFSTGRRARFTARTAVQVAEGGVRFVRRPLIDAGAEQSDRFHVVGSDEAFSSGEDLLWHIATHADADLVGLLGSWLTLLNDVSKDGECGTIDLVPHNLVIGADGTLHVIDVEIMGSVLREQVLRRGLFWMAFHVARISPAGRWGVAQTVRDVAIQLGVAAGLSADGAWIDLALGEEIAVQLEVQNSPQLGLNEVEWEHRFTGEMRASLDQLLVDLPLGDRLPDRMLALQARMAADQRDACAEADRRDQETADLRRLLAEMQNRYDEVMSSRTMRIAIAFRVGVSRIIPSAARQALGGRRSARRGEQSSQR